MRKVIIIHKNTIEKEPPTQMVIQHLRDLGVEVTVITLGLNEFWKDRFRKINVNYIELNLGSFVDLEKRSLFVKLKTWYKYRKAVLAHLWNKENTNALIWFVDADSLAPLLFSSLPNKLSYVMHILEMYDHSKFYRYVINKYVKKAKRLIVCEEIRAAIFNVWFQPKKIPLVLPNKPYSLEENSQALNFLKNQQPDLYHQVVNLKRKVILYQGLVSPERDLSFILKAVNKLGEEYVPVIMGRDYGMIEKYKKQCPSLIHISFIPSPQHLYITSLANIGILMYDPISLNQIFCAPNKIFEYSGYGIPMIGNNIPGLKIPFEKYNCGRIFDNGNIDELCQNILEINENHEQFSKNATRLYNSVDNKAFLKSVLEELNYS